MGAINNQLAYELSQTMADYKASGLPISLATFQSRTNTTSTAGQVNLTDWVNVAGLVNLQCQLSVESPFRPDQNAVLRTLNQYDTKGLLHLLLAGYYPAVLQQYTVVVDGVRLEIMAVEHDSEHTQTRCAVRRYTL